MRTSKKTIDNAMSSSPDNNSPDNKELIDQHKPIDNPFTIFWFAVSSAIIVYICAHLFSL